MVYTSKGNAESQANLYFSDKLLNGQIKVLKWSVKSVYEVRSNIKPLNI